MQYLLAGLLCSPPVRQSIGSVAPGCGLWLAEGLLPPGLGPLTALPHLHPLLPSELVAVPGRLTVAIQH
jgi:hypothetical protein